MKKIYSEPASELIQMRLEAPVCESELAPLTDMEVLGDSIDFIW